MGIRPIFSALLRNKAGLILIGLQMALTLAIVVNALFIIHERRSLMEQPSGVDEANVFTVTSNGFAPGFDVGSVQRDDLRRIRETPGVVAAFSTNSLPLSQGGWSTSIQSSKEEPRVEVGSAIYFADEQAIDSYGLRLIAGRNFDPLEIADFLPEMENAPERVVISAALARALFPEVEDVSTLVGRRVVVGDPERAPLAEIIGIVERLRAPWAGWAEIEERSTLVPYRNLTSPFNRYVIRAEAGQRDRLMGEIEDLLVASNSGRIVRGMTCFEKIREDFYRNDRAVAVLLSVVIGALLLVTGMGIVGLVSFWVTVRVKQIGTRRALGATKPNILSYFLTENFIIGMIGAVAGSILAYAINAWLMSAFGLSRIDWHWVPLGALIVLALGQLAALGPARRASRVSPAVATRTV